MKPTELGRVGEDIAVTYLQKKGFCILARNYRFGKAEIDVIALKGNRLSVVEVKWRSSADFGLPQSFVTPKKQRLLVYAANHFVQSRDLEVELSLDIIAILKTKYKQTIEFIENVYHFF
ncbi:MAG: YraN family protein [Flavobacteriaceae bacterium]|jgi:putative endonuclease